MMNDITLRQIASDDGEFIFKVKKDSFRSYLEMLSGWDEVEQRELHERRLAAQEFRIIQLSGSDVGYVAITRKPDCTRLHQLFIAPEHQRKGAGRACMQVLIRESDGAGLPIRLLVLKVNPLAQKFYRRLGFRETGEDEIHWAMERLPETTEFR